MRKNGLSKKSRKLVESLGYTVLLMASCAKLSTLDKEYLKSINYILHARSKSKSSVFISICNIALDVLECIYFERSEFLIRFEKEQEHE